MQSLSVPASVSKRKRACNGCRSRKKRCDGERPTCALCKKWGLRCEYILPSSHRENGDETLQYTSTLFGRQPFYPQDMTGQDSIGMLPSLEDGFDLAPSNMPQVHIPLDGYPTPNYSPFPLTILAAPESDLLEEASLPTGSTLFELIEIFFTQLHPNFPFIHKTSFYTQLHSGTIHAESELILYAICTIASSLHPDPTVKKRQDAWYEQAKFMYELTTRVPRPPLRTIQSALILVFMAYTRGEFSVCWLCVGKAWRQVASLGTNRSDSSNCAMMGIHRKDGIEDEREGQGRTGSYALYEWIPQTAIEKEECRRTLWMLYIMDRNLSWPTGWPMAVDERHFKLDIPTTDSVFQAMTDDTDPNISTSTPFTRNVNTLIASTSTAKSPLNTFHYLIVAHVLLTRIAELVHSLHDSPDSPEYAQECANLDNSLLKLRLSIPRSATSVLEAEPSHRPHAVWLNLILNTMAILLHYRIAGISATEDAKEMFTRAVAAAKNTAQVVRDTVRVCIDDLTSAHVAPSIYVAGCVLIIHWRLTGDESCKADIEVFELVFERMEDVFKVLGLKFRLALKRDQERDESELLRLREKGYRGLLADCSKWGFVADEVAKMGVIMS